MEIQQFKRVAIFAHFDKHNIIDDYVITYLTRLREVVDNIIFVSDGDVLLGELKKIEHLILDNICQKHGEYDFGSYKRGFLLLQKKYPEILSQMDELVFVNDSCYSLRGFKEVFALTEKEDFDAWALADDFLDYNSNAKYLQSYFIAYRKGVFRENFFLNFINSIKKLEDKGKIIDDYEKGFSLELVRQNKKVGAIFSCYKVNCFISQNLMNLVCELREILKPFYRKSKIKRILVDSLSLYKFNYIHSSKYYFLIKMGFPVMKRASLLVENFGSQKLLLYWREIFKKLNIDDKEILNHLNRIGANYKKVSKNKIVNLFKFYI